MIWNWVHNAPTPELEKIYVDYKKKTGDDFVFAAHWNSVHMLREAMRKAQSTDAKKVAFALENMTYKSPMGEVRMRKTDHQLEAPLYLGIWAKQGSKLQTSLSKTTVSAPVKKGSKMASYKFSATSGKLPSLSGKTVTAPAVATQDNQEANFFVRLWRSIFGSK